MLINVAHYLFSVNTYLMTKKIRGIKFYSKISIRRQFHKLMTYVQMNLQ